MHTTVACLTVFSTAKQASSFNRDLTDLWQYGLWSFQMGYVKLERFLHKNQHTQRKLLNFENWSNGEPQ